MENLGVNIPETEAEREAKMGKIRGFLIRLLKQTERAVYNSDVAALFREDSNYIEADADETIRQMHRIQEAQRVIQ